MFKPISYQDQIVGYSLRVGDYQIFYGTRFLKRSDLREVFPNYHLCFVKQVHGNKVVSGRSTTPLEEADGHWSDRKNRALIVQTADCLPVFLWSGDIICGVHAGWRGVQKQIILEALKCFPESASLEASIGPCIDQDHFEVGEDVAWQLKKSSPNALQWVKNTSKNTYRVSLVHILQDQLSSKIRLQKWYLFNKSTFLEKTFHSYRRTAEKKVGQYSFIVRL